MADFSRADKETSCKALFKVMASLLEEGHDHIAEGKIVPAREMASAAATIGDALVILAAREVD